MLTNTSVNVIPTSKRLCRFGNILFDFYSAREKKNLLIGKWLTSNRILLDYPLLSIETIAIVQKYFNVAVNKCDLFTKNSASKNDTLFNFACQMISTRISNWIQSTVNRLFFNLYYISKYFF